jgi:bacterioferritin-associated ferredoxin
VHGRLSDHDRLAEARLHLGLRKPLAIRAQVKKVERVFRTQVGRLFDERVGVGERCDPCMRAHREVVPAVRTDPERRVELVVPVVRMAFGTGVRMLLARRLGDVPMLDGDVDPRGHEPSSLEP